MYPAKFHDVYSSSSEVLNCARFGRHSGSIFSSGGEDCRVSVWRVGKPQPILLLNGHSTPIDSVAFDQSEEFLCAGARGGSLKLWDLSSAGKILRTLTGHRAAIRALDFHPYGDFFASGSLDTNVKIWDIRKKHCIQTYRGHSSGVSTLLHSPDGRWIVSGDSTGSVKVWDLTAGKLLQELESPFGRTAPITAIHFHPSEFIAAVSSGSAVEFWDLENFQLIGSSHDQPNISDTNEDPVKAIAFTRSGESLISCSSLSVKSLGWEPYRVLGRLSTGQIPEFAGVCDLVQAPAPEQEFLTLARNKNVLTLHFIPIDSIANGNSSAAAPAGAALKAEEAIGSGRGVNRDLLSKPAPQPASVSPRAISSSPFSSAPSSSVSSSTPASSASAASSLPSWVQASAAPQSSAAASRSPTHSQSDRSKSSPVASDASRAAASSSSSAARGLVANDAFFKAHQAGQSIFLPSKGSSQPASAPSSVPSDPSSSLASTLIPAPSTVPIGLSASQFQSASSNPLLATSQDPIASHIQSIRASIQVEHSNMRDHLRDRLTSIRVLSSEWQANQYNTSGIIRNCFQSLIRMKNLSASFDFLSGAESQLTRSGNLTFDSALLMMPILSQLIASPFESYVKCGLRFLRFILWSFSPLMEAARKPLQPGDPVDVQREDRAARAAECIKLLEGLNEKQIHKISGKNSEIGTIAKEVQGQINKLVRSQ